MSGYNMEHFLADFADRTISNLRFIEDGAEVYKLHEVTQLINSLLGLIIIPVEYYKKTYKIKNCNKDRIIQGISLNDYNVVANMIEKCDKEKRFYSDYDRDRDRSGRISVSEFINHLRNAIAHGGNNGIHFFPVSDSRIISSVIFYDNNEFSKKIAKRDFDTRAEINEFCIKLSVAELKVLVTAISSMYCKFEKKDRRPKEKKDKYASDIRALEELLMNGRADKSKVIFELEESETT